MNDISRRSFMVLTGLASAGMAGGSNTAKRPNLLVIHTDEHNFRTLGCYRKTLPEKQALMWGKNAVVETPNIDWIAENGALCTKFYATTPLCSPSRASMISGRYPQNTPVTNNNVPLDGAIISFAEILGRNGYATGYSGKWHLDGDGKPQWAPERKFGFKDNAYMYNRGHWKKLADTPGGPKVDTGDKPSYDVAGATEKNFTTDWLTDRTIEFIEKHKDGPFCYMLSIPDPHGPDSVRAPYDTMYSDMNFETPHTAARDAESAPSWAKPSKGNTKMSQYFGMVKCIDDNVGRILDHLRKRRILDNTIVIFTADHGDLCGEHGRHNKSVPLEGSAKVPFVIHYPARIAGGTIVPYAMGMVDFLPTVLSFMGVKPAGKEEGRDASFLFDRENPSDQWKDVTFVRGSSKWLAAFTSTLKLVVSTVDEPWLIDMEKDPDELKNFCEDPAYAAQANWLAKELLEYGKQFRDKRVSEGRIPDDLARLAKGDPLSKH